MKGTTGRQRRRRSAVALNLALVLAVSGVVGYAVSAQGYKTHRTDLNDGGIWVTDGRLSSFGRVNKPIGQIDAIIYSDAHSDVDVVQQDSAVLGENLSTRRLMVLDPTTASPVDGRQALLPRSAQVQLAGSTLASIDPTAGEVWAARLDTEGGLPDISPVDSESPSLASVGADAGLAVTQSGTVLVASAANDTITRIEPQSFAFAAPVTEKLETPLSGAPAVTAVGETAVVLDQDTGELLVVGGARAVVDVGAVLQQPGPDASAVLLETPTALVAVDLETGVLETLASVTSGSPTAPVRLGGCLFGAWSGGRGYVTTQCGDEPAATVTLNRHTSDLVFRVNRGQILLNDRLSGAVWNIDDTPTKIDNWEAFRNPQKDDDKTSDEENENPGDRRPPKARNDKFGARPGRTTVTHPLDNDSASAGRMLAVSSVEQLTGVAGNATISPDGQTIQFQQPSDARGTSSYEYFISDGRRDVSAHATITLSSRTRGNEAPVLRSGFTSKSWPVPPSGTMTVPVLTDWRDPADGDAVDVVSATAAGGSAAGAAVQTTSDGRLRVTAPNRPGPLNVTYAVSDGRSAPVEQDVVFEVLNPDVDPPVAASAEPDIISAEAGEWVTIHPLANDLPGADPYSPDAQMKLGGAVTGTGGAEVSTDLAEGTISFRAAVAKTFLLDYDVAFGDAPLAAGKIRVDVREREKRGPVAMPDTATLYGPASTIVDVLVNDFDPRGGVLMVESARALAPDQIDVAVIDGRWVRISSRQGEIRPTSQVVRYVASNGSRSVVGEIQVTQRPVLRDNAPVTEPDQVTVRAGSSAVIAVLDNDFSPSGDQLTLVGDLAGEGPGQLEITAQDGRDGALGAAFVSGRVVRYVAPADVKTANTVTATYVASNTQGESSPGRVEITVLPEGKHNQLPQAPIIEGRVVAGDIITLRLPGSGLDPDGDSVTVLGLGSAPTLGRVVKVGANSIEYQAYPSSTGTDEFDYLITDALGGRATGTVRMAVISPSPPQPPLAVADSITVEPGRTATVYPLANDFVSAGDQADIELVDPPDGVTLTDVSGPVTIETPEGAAGRNVEVVYSISNGLDSTQSTITVHTATPYNNPPVVYDAFGATADSAAVKVDVLKSAYDPDGPSSQLRITDVYAPDAEVSGGKITVLRADEARVVAFRVEDTEGGAATANLYVPPAGRGLPYVTSKVIKVDPGKQRRVALSDYIVNPSGAPVRLDPGTEVVGSPHGLVTVDATGQAALTVDAAATYRGPGAVNLAVAAKGDPQPVVLSIPVQVGADVPVLKCPTEAITVPQGDQVSLDIRGLCNVYAANEQVLDELTYTAAWDQEGSGLSLVSPEGREIEVAAAGSARTGTEATLSVTSDGSKPGLIHLRVGEAPAPTVSAISVTDLKAGESRTVDVAKYLTPGVPDPEPRVVSINAVNGRDVTAAKVGGTLVRLSAGAKAKGSATFRITMSDSGAGADAGRQASNLLTVRLLGVPEAPGAPVPTGSLQSEAVHLTWRAPTANGAPIDRYEVVANNGSKHSCASTSCLIKGLANGTSYTFTVRAHNAIGWSEASARSRPAVPEGVPGPVSNIHVTKLGDGRLTIAWSKPTLNAKHIDDYKVVWKGHVQFTGGATSKTVFPLDNNRKYAFTVYAHNAAGWSAVGVKSAPFQSLGEPGTPEPPVVSARDPGSGNTATLDVDWDEVPSNSEFQVRYTLSDNGQPVPGCTGQTFVGCTITGVPLDGRTHSFTVGATNGEKAGPPSAATNWTAVAPPLAWGAWDWEATGHDTATVSFTVPDSRGKESAVAILVDGSPVWNGDVTGTQTRTISVGDNDGPHEVKLKLCNGTSDTCSTSTTKDIQTWGPLGPSTIVSVTPVVTDVTKVAWQITVDPNGAPVDVVVADSPHRANQTYHLDKVDKHTFVTDSVDIGFDTLEIISVDVTDPVRGRNIAKKFFNTRTDPPPPPDVKVRRGAKCNDADGPPCHPQGGGGDDCVDTSCGFITVEVANFFGPVTCTVSAQGGGVLGTVNLPDNSKLETDLYFGVTGNWVKASCDGPSGTSETGSFDWPN